MCGEILQEVQEAKYLDVTISNNLKWEKHISAKTSQANSTLHFISRTLQHSPDNARQLAYFTLVRSTREYSCTVWDPHYGKDIDRLEMVNRRAARIVKGRSLRDREVSVTALLEELKWKTLEERRKDLCLILMYKIGNSLVTVPTTPLKPASSRTGANHQFKYHTIRTSCDPSKYSYFPRTIPEWNNLKSDIVNITSVDAFKARPHPPPPTPHTNQPHPFIVDLLTKGRQHYSSYMH